MKRNVLLLTIVCFSVATIMGCGSTSSYQTPKASEEVEQGTSDYTGNIEEEASKIQDEIEDAAAELERAATEIEEELDISKDESEAEDIPKEEADDADAEGDDEKGDEGEKSEEDSSTLADTFVREEVKEAIDSYEDFVDEYCEFVKSYDMSDLSMLTKYTELMTRELEMTKEFEDIEDKELTDAEALYYSEVSIRCSKKMLDAASQIN